MTNDPPIQEWRRDGYLISTDRARIDIDAVHGYLSRAYWSEGIPRETVARAIAGALNFGIYTEPHPVGAQPVAPSRSPIQQVGGARVITDCATFAYLADVFVLEEHRGHGLGIWLMECVAAHPSLQGLRRWLLGTRDAHTLYEKTGWTRIAPDDGRWMERVDLDAYKR